MPATLQVTPADAERFEIRIGNVASIGRLPDSTVCLSSGPVVSRQHAVIRSHNGSDYQIIDLGSLNGTYVNGQRVVLPVQLDNRARIRIAGNEIVFERCADLSGACDESTLPGSISSSGYSGYVSSFVALLVCDIRGFTMATENLSKDDLAQTLGGWFREAGNLIHLSGGNIDKFVGDAFFAYWTKRDTRPSECEAAFESSQRLLQLAKTLAWPDAHEPFEIVVALNCGSVTCRNMGVMAESDAVILGDAVNTVFRLESLAKQLKQPLLASHDFVSSLPSADGLIDLGWQTLKGKQNPVRVFGLNEGVGSDTRKPPRIVQSDRQNRTL